LAACLGPEEDSQEIAKVLSDAFTQHEAMILGKSAGVVAGIQNPGVGLREDRQFLAVPMTDNTTP
jgi:hypothetical protein